MKKLILSSLLIVSFSNCKDSSTKKESTQGEKEVVIDKKSNSLLEKACYYYHEDNNTINFEITDLENSIVKGNLTYALNGKDSNSGTFIGKLEGDKLFGEYTFMSEGVESKREVAFLIKDHQLIEGYGELDENGTAFVSKTNIKYSSTMPLTKIDCHK